ncbi:uncharacterized protein LOC142235503 [Haematobia irritans]|uniref:uncharacterized protein LOC142235503 n=1 Tax=Haematobia irritans TaxID=7368 RepID=UPI003F5058C3
MTVPTYYWTNSTIVLNWINSRSSSFHTFVANRIVSIQDNTTPEQWRHVSSKDNPADIISRGLDPHQLPQTTQRMHGPFFLHGDEKHWPPAFLPSPDSIITKRKQNLDNLMLAVDAENFLYRINHRNSFKTLQRIVVYVLRFIKNSKTLRIAQHSNFKEDILQLDKNRELKGSSQIKAKVLRVGGRLEESTLSFNAKHPMLLPFNDPISRLIFESLHKENKHCGPTALLSTVRQRFWPIKGKHLARETVHKCIQCARSKPKLLKQIMGNLPETRVTPTRPFINAGVDYCGPIWVHFKTRGKRPQKAHLAIFCCFSTKAVHLELVTDLTTDAFIGALKRFIGRRGHCQNLYCDCATIFVGAKNQLAELSTSLFSTTVQEKIQRECATRSITFHFIPPRSPHFGGLWEAAVKSAKGLLIKEISSASLTYEEMETIVIEVEEILNSRPRAPPPNNPIYAAALTPGHFLIGEPLTAQVDVTAQATSSTLAKRWELEYINELQQRNKWQTKAQNLQLGTIVAIKDNLPVMNWRLGKVIETFPGSDGFIRTAAVKTSTGIIKRAIHLLAPLPLEQANDERGDNSLPLNQSTASSDKDNGSPLPKRANLTTTNMPHPSTKVLVYYQDYQQTIYYGLPPEYTLSKRAQALTTTVIDNDLDLTNIEKFQHLRSLLVGAALNTISSLETNDCNYNKALELLKNRFDNKLSY